MDYIKFQCNNCNLCKKQYPLFNKKKEADIIVVGMSSKIRKFEDEIPLDTRTRSGKAVDEIETIAREHKLCIYRTNLVKGAPLDSNQKLRYPNQIELDACFEHLYNEINEKKPKVIILLGDIVRRTVSDKLGIMLEKPSDNTIGIADYNNIKIVSLYHPSYLLRSKERKRTCYELIGQLLTTLTERSC